MADNPTTFQRLRALLNRAIKGKFTNALLESLAVGDEFNEQNILAMKDNLFVATAERRFLDKLLASMGVIRPPGVGIDDDSFRNLAISTTNNQLVSNIFLEVLELFYGEDAVKANVLANGEETYQLTDGMDLYIKQDGKDIPLRVEFSANDFENIAQAKAIEIASIISREAVKGGYTLYATDYLDAGAGKTYLQLYSGTKGPKSAISVVGGSAQNIFKFPSLKATTQIAGTQFTVTVEGGSVRYTWSGGADPGLQNVDAGDYVNIKYSPFPFEQSGSFTVTKVVPDVVSSGYFEITNPIVQTGGTIVLADADDLRFFFPRRNTLNDLTRFATLYEINPYEVVIFLPATTKIVKRELIGGWHVHSNGVDKSFTGSYMFNPKSGFPITKESVAASQPINAGQVYTVISATSPTTAFPDEIGFVVLDYGTSNQEGPIRYLGRPSNNTLLLDASYTFKKTHVNADITLVKSVKPYVPTVDGTDYPTYLTGTIKGRVEAEALANKLVAAGVFLNIVVVYPQSKGWNSVLDAYGEDIT
jgi:hypothetical protein